jgi:sulfur carrier protein ThiS
MKLYSGGTLTFYMPQKSRMIEIHISASIGLKDILSQLQIPLEEVDLAAVNGELVDAAEAIIRDQDVVRIFSSVNGG